MENTNQNNNRINNKQGSSTNKIADIWRAFLGLLKKFYECIIPNEIRRDEKALKKLLRIFIVVCIFFAVQATFITIVIFTTVKISGESVRLPQVVGLDMYEAMELLQTEGFNLNIEVQYFEDRPTKTVVVQKPDADTILRRGRTVNLIINDTINIGDMPSVLGLNYEQALEKINDSISTSKKVNIKTLQPLYVSDSKQEPGAILAQIPLENEKLSSGSAIQLTINSYQPRTTSGGGSSGNAQFNYTVPMSVAENSELSITLEDANGLKTVYKRTVKAAERISFRYNLSGSGTITVYYDEIPFENISVQE